MGPYFGSKRNGQTLDVLELVCNEAVLRIEGEGTWCHPHYLLLLFLHYY